ncbi:MAG: decaprenylphospho-beta-D-erythro-pentofuranosid-2-ulose 2-reductase [Planctomycetota bacterium]|jgi:decaprenylphospho-beta-D-erythro-pentofuranosid-2-ulose 2-reductase
MLTMSSPETTESVPISSAAGPRALVVGASSGMGAALVRRMAGQGYRVMALARRLDRLEALAAEVAGGPGEVHVRQHDVLDRDSVPALFEESVHALGGLDLVIYASGVMPEVGPLEYDTQKDIGQVEVNLCGAMAWCNEAARLFQSQRSGTILGIGSVAGDRGRKQNPAYHATKAAFATYLESLRNRLDAYGVRVVTIKPGPVETEMTAGLGDMPLMISADKAAAAILRASKGGFFDTRYLPLPWLPIMTIIKAIPSRIFRHLNV